MELANLNPEWEAEQRRVFLKHADDPKYPKSLTLAEIMQQIERLPNHILTEKAEQWGGGGKLSSQFRNYVKQCHCMCWHSWQEAWKDFAFFMGFNGLPPVLEIDTDRTHAADLPGSY